MWRMMTTIMSAVLLVATLAAAVIGPTSSVGAAEPNMSLPPAANYDTLGNCRALREDYPTALATGRTHILVVDRTDPITANQLTILEDALRRIEGRLNLGDTLFVHQITDNYVRHRQALMAECVPGCEERSVLEVLYKRRCDEARNARLKASVVDLMWQTVGTIVANTGTLPFTQIIGTLNALAIDYSDRPNKTFYPAFPE